MDQSESTQRRPVKFGIWGATGGGKTTYLGALAVAMLRENRNGRRWRMTGKTQAALDFQNERWEELVEERSFPQATDGITELSWLVSGTPTAAPAAASEPLFRIRRRRETPAPAPDVVFQLETMDVPGDSYLVTAGDDRVEKAVAHLADSTGLIYLFDPVREIERSTGEQRNLGFFQKVVGDLMRRVESRDGLYRGRLPHYVAVCVTKFDDPAVFDFALEGDWVTFDPEDGVPRVPVEQTGLFFDELARRLTRSDADLIKSFLETYFCEDRIRYFVVSSIGFKLGVDGRFDQRDYRNTEPGHGGIRIRESVRPLNVLEPLVWLHHVSSNGADR